MADEKVSALSLLVGADLVSDDRFVVVDTSAGGSGSKAIVPLELLAGLIALNSTTELTFGGPLGAQIFKPEALNVSALPAASSHAGAFAYVDDATTDTAGSTVTGGGALNAPVWSDGTNWLLLIDV